MIRFGLDDVDICLHGEKVLVYEATLKGCLVWTDWYL